MNTVLCSLLGILFSLSALAGLPSEDAYIKNLRSRFANAHIPQEEDIYDSVFSCQGRKAKAGDFNADFVIKELRFYRTIGYLPFVDADDFRLDDRSMVRFNSAFVGYLNSKKGEEYIALRVGPKGELLFESSIVSSQPGLKSVIRYPNKAIAQSYGICRRLSYY